MIQGCERRSWPRCRPSTTAAWRLVRPAVGTPSVGSRSLVHQLGVPSPPVQPLVPVLPRPQSLGQGQRGCKQRLRPRRHQGVGGREAMLATSRRRVACFGPPQKRQRTAGGAEDGSQAQGTQRRVSPPPPPPSGPPPPPPPPGGDLPLGAPAATVAIAAIAAAATKQQQQQRSPRFQGRWKVQGPK
jgi:hypothetical protein